MKKIFITICLSIICNFLFAQNKTVDSLKKVLKTTKDVHKRIDLYAEIGNNLIALNLDLAKPYTDTAFKIANTCNYEKGLAKVFNNYGKIYYRHSEYEKSLLYLEKSVALYKKMDNKERIGTLLSNIAIINIEKGDLELALNNLTQSITILEKTNNKFQLASSYNILGGYYLNISKFKESNEYFFKALKLKELIKDTIGQIISFNNIFINFYNLNDFEKAIFYNQKSMNLSKLVKDTMGIADCILNEACVLSSKKECKIAIEKYFECYKLYKSIDNKNSMCLTLGNIGNNYIRLKDYDNALNYLKQSLDIAKVIDNKLRIIFALRQIGETYNFDGNPKKAIPFIDSSLVISKKINNLDEIKTNLFTLAESYKLLGNCIYLGYQIKKK